MSQYSVKSIVLNLVFLQECTVVILSIVIIFQNKMKKFLKMDDHAQNQAQQHQLVDVAREQEMFKNFEQQQ